MKIFGVDFAPLNIPMERRLQTIGILFFEFLFFQGGSVVGLTILISLLFTSYYWLTLVYIIWYIYDIETCHQGGRINRSARKWRIWKHYCNYFPMKLVKTVDLDPNENYLFAVHPHGIMSFSAYGNFSTEGTGFSQIFPGLRVSLLVLKEQFYGPLMRELLLWSGTCAASVKNLKYILTNKGQCKSKGQVCALIIGGAAESLESRPGVFRLVLKKRKGFIRVALETGTSLVPVFSFGENEVFYTKENPEDSKLRKFQDKVKKLTNFGLPIINGRGIFNYSFGLMPHRRPMHTVVGEPMKITKNTSPTNQEIDELHELYIKNLTKLFDEHKVNYLSDKTVQLQII